VGFQAGHHVAGKSIFPFSTPLTTGDAMKRLLILGSLLLTASCTVGPDVKDGMSFGSLEGKAGKKISLSFERGPEFISVKNMGFMKVKITPQIAVWMEDTNGSYLGTVYVTAGFGDQKWKYVGPKGDSCGRSMCVPYWLNRYKAAGNAAPTPPKPLPDAVTGATPTGAFTINMVVPDSIGVFKLFAEWNSSFDNNDTFSKKKSSFNGQPSAVACARIDLADSSRTADTLKVIGRGGESGTDGKLYNDADKLTTALKVFGTIAAQRK